MLKKLSFPIVLVLLLAGTAHAQTPEPPHVEHTDPFWQVAYWNNVTLGTINRPVRTAAPSTCPATCPSRWNTTSTAVWRRRG